MANQTLPSSVESDLRALAPSWWDRLLAGPRRLLEILRDPPDLIERPVIIEFIVNIYPDYTARITATKLSGPTREEIAQIAQTGVNAVLSWAKQQGVTLQINPKK